MRTVRAFLVLSILLGAAPLVHAHGGGPHIMGVVKSAAPTSIAVTNTAGKEVSIAVDDKTTIERNGKAAALKDVTPGERVVVHTRKTDAGLVAVMIKLGTTAKAQSHVRRSAAPR